jgi:hypothetical protein
MMLTVQTLFNDAGIVSAVINRVMQTRKDKIYWQEYLTFRQVTTRVFTDYIGNVTGVMAGSINSRYGEKPIRERKNIGSGYGEVAYLGDAYQMSIDRLSELQDLIDKFNAARTSEQNMSLQEIINFVMDDYRQVMLAAHKRMDLVFGSILMTGAADVKNKDNRTDANTPDVLKISLPFNTIAPTSADVMVDSKKMFVTYLQKKLAELEVDYGTYFKMIMSRPTFLKYIIGSSEFGDKFKMQLSENQMYMSTGLVSSDLASAIFTGLGMPPIEVKADYVKDQTGTNQAVYADGHITLIPSQQIGWMRHHTPYEATDPVAGRTYTPSDGQMLISNYRDKNGRYMEYTAEWIPQIANPNLITNIDLTGLAW